MQSIADVCVAACADAWRGDGEVLASAFGAVPAIGARLARASFEPDLLLSDGEAFLVANDLPVGPGEHHKVVEGWLPFSSVFDLLASGRRHVMMMPSQIDRFGNMNISCVGDWDKPKRMLIGARGGPGNTINHATSYWVPNHSPRVFVESVDFVSGAGFDSVRRAGSVAARYHDLRRIVTNLCVFDFESPDSVVRLRSVHPGVTVDQVVEATGFAPVLADEVLETRLPVAEELRLIEMLDPAGLRAREVPS